MKNKSDICLKIGFLFTVLSFLAAFTIFIPMYSVFPSELFSQFLSSTFDTISYETAGFLTMILLISLLVLVVIFIFKKLKKIAETNHKLGIMNVICMMVLFYFIVHNLGYILLLAFNGFPIDALNALYSIISFPFSSISFVILGFFMDKQWDKYQNKVNSFVE